jgi:hypothetical protein
MKNPITTRLVNNFQPGHDSCRLEMPLLLDHRKRAA